MPEKTSTWRLTENSTPSSRWCWAKCRVSEEDDAEAENQNMLFFLKAGVGNNISLWIVPYFSSCYLTLFRLGPPTKWHAKPAHILPYWKQLTCPAAERLARTSCQCYYEVLFVTEMTRTASLLEKSCDFSKSLSQDTFKKKNKGWNEATKV